jgi:hypothetical protein
VGSSNPSFGVFGVTPLTNGNYVVDSPSWNGSRGAVTWADGSMGIRGTIDSTNSLLGSNPNDNVGYGDVYPLTNGDYVVSSSTWNNNRGAATWGDGGTGIAGVVSADNSLVGSNPGDKVGANVKLLSNGNYVVNSNQWNAIRGAVTWGNGSTGVSGIVSDANSLVGSSPNDEVGFPGVYALNNGNYVVCCGKWNGGRGAVTLADGSTGVSGTIATDISLVGSNPGDMVGAGGVFTLSNGNYVVDSPIWNGIRGAVTWENANTGLSGTVSAANSLVGNNPGDLGFFYVTALSNGNYVVTSPYWNGVRGAVTWGNGSTGTSGTISDANSLIGSNPGDQVSTYRAIPLTNGNYVIESQLWNNNRGAVTWGNGNTGVSGTISDANSLLGSNPGDYVGSNVIALSNGN